MDSVRERSRVKNPGRGVLKIEFLDFSGNVIGTDYLDQTNLATVETIQDVVHYDFKRRSKSGELIIGPLSMSRQRYDVTGGSFEFPEGDYGTRFTGDMIPMFSMADSPNRSQRNSCLSRTSANAAISALKKLNTASIDMGENLATLGQTVSMFRQPLSAANSLLSRMEKKRWRSTKGSHRAQDIAKATSNTWLEYSFGFRPIVKDCSEIVKTIGDSYSLIESAVRVARGAARSEWSGSSDVSYYHRGETRHANTYADGSIDTMANVSIGCGVYYRLSVGGPLDFLSRGLGLGVHNLPTTAWNVLPYSWVVDQVFNVGDWIKALTPDPGLSILGKWMTTIEKTVHTQTCRLSILRSKGRNGPLTWYYGDAGSRRETVTNITRVLDFGLPSTPQFKPVWFGLAQAVNDAAFGFQSLDRMLKRWSH